MQYRKVFSQLLSRVEEPRKFIQALLGPRQVGKTTLALQLQDHLDIPFHYITADTATLEDLSWLQKEWETARYKLGPSNRCVLIIDEVQKIPNWSHLVKTLWDEDTRHHRNLKVVILGSSPWLMQKGLTESLAGRFEILPVTHWSFQEMESLFGWDVEHYIYYGGYPGPASFAHAETTERWKNYINDSLIETTISRDILLMTQVNKPILLRRLFQLGCLYSSQILSYQKMLGQLQDAGNTTTLAHYLDLLTGAGILTGISKFSAQHVRSKGSSPKLQVFNTALMSAQSNKDFKEAQLDTEFWGRLVESAVGAHLLNAIRGTQIELFYWREGNQEVDFVLKKGEAVAAIEVKSSSKKESMPGMSTFSKLYNPKRLLLIGNSGIPLVEFFKTPIEQWL